MNACEEEAGKTTRVLLVEDHAVFRQALSLLLSCHPHIEVRQAGSLAEARLLLNGIDVVALNNYLPDGAGTDLIVEVHGHNPRPSVIVLNDAQDLAGGRLALAAGANKVISKAEAAGTIVDEIRHLGRVNGSPRPY